PIEHPNAGTCSDTPSVTGSNSNNTEPKVKGSLMARKTNKHNHRAAQTFSIAVPDAESVQLAGDFTDWQTHAIPLHKERGGAWRATVELEPGEYRYRFLIDGQWCDDPTCATRVPNPYGGQDSVRRV